MNIPHALFLWREAYIRAVCETDDSLMMSRIYEARAAIEQRRLTPVTNEDELVAPVTAEAGLQSMIAERTSKTVPCFQTFWDRGNQISRVNSVM